MATEKSLKFIRTMSVATFKREMGVETIKVIVNPKDTDKTFFESPQDTTVRGAVSKAWTVGEPTVISEVCPKDGGVAFYMLHIEGVDSDNVLATL